MENNLFTYATHELSQDAFICWLLSHAIKECKKDRALTACAQKFIGHFIPELAEESIYLSEAPIRQYKSIDILLTVNDRYKVVIEDKTYTKEHSDQLNRYKETIEYDFEKDKYKFVGIYYYIGFQGDLSNIYQAGYQVCDRKTILSILELYEDKTDNDIFLSYYQYLKNLNNKAEDFENIKVSEWDWCQTYAFYDSCKKWIEELGMYSNYGYVANQSGGFYGMWIFNGSFKEIDGSNFELYLQCEYKKPDFRICYRASTDEGKIYGDKRNQLIWAKDSKGEWELIPEEYHFRKPARYGSGRSVALGEYVAEYTTSESVRYAIKNAIHDFKKMTQKLGITK